MSLSPAQTERTKLTATFFNSVASGTVLVALVGPFISIGMGVAKPGADLLNPIGLSLFGLVLAIMLLARQTHFAGVGGLRWKPRSFGFGRSLCSAPSQPWVSS